MVMMAKFSGCEAGLGRKIRLFSWISSLKAGMPRTSAQAMMDCSSMELRWQVPAGCGGVWRIFRISEASG